jgi:uncharacterized protein YraI
MRGKCWLIIVGLVLVASVALAAASVKVVTQQAAIRSDKRFFASVVATAPYGAVLQTLARDGDWLQVQYGQARGWIHISAVEEQKFQLSSLMQSKAKETSQDEVALAGKGFTPEVEKAFRAKNPQMKYDLVDRIETYQVAAKDLQVFVKDGWLREPGGAS